MHASQVPPDHAAVSNGPAHWQKLGIAVILGFTVKGLLTALLLAITFLEFIHY
jgi:hypothetical protein